jgi:hypothetical protein
MNRSIVAEMGASKKPRKRLITVVACVAATALLGLPGLALDLVRNGKPAATIVVPAQPLSVESYAAEEFRYHVRASTGADLRIVSEDRVIPSGARVYLGHCRAAMEAKVDPSELPGNGYRVKTVGRYLFLAGKDTTGDPLGRDTHAGTLFGVYDILENNMGVRWLWPGKLGEVIPRRKSLSLPVLDGSVKPLLWFKEWRGGLSGGGRGASVPSRRSFVLEQARWMRRQRFGRSVQPSYGHSFGAYWGRFSETHREYFNMMPDGTRGPDPLEADMTPVGEWIHMCVSQPSLWKQILDDWKARGMPEFLNVCENDGYAACACPQCLAWDEPDPDFTVPFDRRLEAAKKAFDARNDDWMLQLGSLSDRYAKFWKAISEQARQLRPDVKVVSYVYDNYRKPPVKPVRLSRNVLCGFVPWAPFPYNKQASEQFQKEWEGWSNTGCVLFLRPNYTLYGHNYPLFYARDLGADLKFAMVHAMKGTDFDSLTGQYATQGPTLYMLAKILNHPEASVEGVLDEYCAAFGAAGHTVKEYFHHWETVNQRFSAEEVEKRRRAKRKYGSALDLIMGPEIFTQEAMRTGWTILERARKQAAGDSTASARVEWLARGLQQVDLVLAAERAYEIGFDTGDRTAFQKAYQALSDFRAQHGDDLISNIGFLTEDENRLWKVPQPRQR